jgi:hypothetical protein
VKWESGPPFSGICLIFLVPLKARLLPLRGILLLYISKWMILQARESGCVGIGHSAVRSSVSSRAHEVPGATFQTVYVYTSMNGCVLEPKASVLQLIHRRLLYPYAPQIALLVTWTKNQNTFLETQVGFASETQNWQLSEAMEN